jgi:hypothetical protein
VVAVGNDLVAEAIELARKLRERRIERFHMLRMTGSYPPRNASVGLTAMARRAGRMTGLQATYPGV